MNASFGPRFLLLAILLAACGSSSTPPGSSSADSGSSSSGLQCATYGWCTSYSPSSRDVQNPPPLTGGRIENGVYRLQAGTFSAEAFVFDGTSVVEVGTLWSNRSGTWTADGGRLTMNLTTYCDYTGETQSANARHYEFAVVGDDLYLKDTGGTSIHRFTRVSSLCDTDTEFQCRVQNCGCAETVNQPLREQRCY